MYRQPAVMTMMPVDEIPCDAEGYGNDPEFAHMSIM
jgi:hypothetical protein